MSSIRQPLPTSCPTMSVLQKVRWSSLSRSGCRRLTATINVGPIERGEASLSVSRLRLVEHGVGLAIIDSQTAGEQGSSAVEFRPLESSQYLTLWAMRPRFQPKSKLVEAFETLVFESAACQYREDRALKLIEPSWAPCPSRRASALPWTSPSFTDLSYNY